MTDDGDLAAGPDFYDRKGRPIDMRTWERLAEDRRYKVVRQHYDRHVFVSTVWLGMDHSWLPNGSIEIFESMIFGGPLNHCQERYTTEEEALFGQLVLEQRVARAHERQTRRKAARIARAYNYWRRHWREEAPWLRARRSHKSERRQGTSLLQLSDRELLKKVAQWRKQARA